MQQLDETRFAELLESIYSLELDDQTWLTRVLSSTTLLSGAEHSYLAYFYDASRVESLDVWNVCTVSVPPEVRRTFELWRRTVCPGYVRTTLRSLRVGSARRTGMPYMKAVLEERERVGWGDILNVNGLHPSGIGCLCTVGTREREFAPVGREMAIYLRIAGHLATAFRCRRRLGLCRTPREAELDLIGSGVAPGHRAGDDGLGSPRTAPDVRGSSFRTRWTLVDTFDENGQRFVVAREDRPRVPSFEALTDRERQVVVHAALGFSNKEIAFSLGISDSTVRVLMARAARKFGVRSRAELLAHPSLSDIHRHTGRN